MAELLTSAQMRAIERAAIDSGEVTGLDLMERAGRGVVEAIFDEWPELGGRGASPSGSPGYLETKESGRAVVLCGPGNNGGDGFVISRLLKERGWTVEVFLYGEASKLPADARRNYDRWSEMGAVTTLTESAFARSERPDIFIDAIFGTGLRRPVSGAASFVLKAVNTLRGRGIRSVSVDIPSGYCADSGKPLGVGSQADLTVSFHRQKLGHSLSEGAAASGKLVVVDIGLPDLASDATSAAFVKSSTRLKELSWQLSKQASGHKYWNGSAFVLSGPHGFSGAARLAARGALRVGAGLVTVASPQEAMEENAAQLTAIMLREIEDARALGDALADKRINALCLGPGLGVGERTRMLVVEALGPSEGRGVVLDADALTAFREDPEACLLYTSPSPRDS